MSAQVVIICDGCATVLAQGRTLTAARQDVHDGVGVTRRGKDYCAECVNSGRA